MMKATNFDVWVWIFILLLLEDKFGSTKQFEIYCFAQMQLWDADFA